MNTWEIKVLYYGKITVPKSGLTPNLDPDLVIDCLLFGFPPAEGEAQHFGGIPAFLTALSSTERHGGDGRRRPGRLISKSP